MKTYCVYIMTNASGTLYVGMTSNIKRRIAQHKNHLVEGFTCKYRINKLVHVESFGDVGSAIGREKQMKRWRREKKIKLVNSVNPQWNDLSADWFE